MSTIQPPNRRLAMTMSSAWPPISWTRRPADWPAWLASPTSAPTAQLEILYPSARAFIGQLIVMTSSVWWPACGHAKIATVPTGVAGRTPLTWNSHLGTCGQSPDCKKLITVAMLVVAMAHDRVATLFWLVCRVLTCRSHQLILWIWDLLLCLLKSTIPRYMMEACRRTPASGLQITLWAIVLQQWVEPEMM